MLKWVTHFTRKLEAQAANAGLVYRFASRYYREIIEKEAVLAGITAKDHVLCVGGGVCPFSAILFHQLTGAKVTVVDNNAACIPKAQQLIRRLGLGNHVHVHYGDGANLHYSEYTVVHLALQVSPLESVISQVEKRLAPGARLMVRRPKKQLCGLYCDCGASENLLQHCPYTTHKARNVGSTLLYINYAA